MLAGLVALFLILLAWLAITAPLSKSLEPIAPPEITLLAADGTPIARSGAVVEEPVAVDRLPPHVVEAFLAIEDRRFYSHWGIDPRGLARALWSNITGSSVQGGSTITQQLAKISFLTPERSLTRKLREMLIAFWLEAWLSKDEILSRYLSNAYFGDNVYGLRAASLHYFYRQPEKLKPEQAILLAGLVQAPSRFAPTRNWQGASKRAAMVRAAMVDAGYLTQAEADALPQPRLDVHERPKLANGTYFADWAMPQARALTEMSHSRLTLTTTLDARLHARQSASSRVLASARRRSRWWRCAPMARSSRWSAARITRNRPSTARPRRSVSPAPPSSCSSGWRRSKRGWSRIRSSRTARSPPEAIARATPGTAIAVPSASKSVRAFEQCRRRPPVPEGRQREGDQAGDAARPQGAVHRGRSQPGAGQRQRNLARDDRGLCRGRGQPVAGRAARVQA